MSMSCRFLFIFVMCLSLPVLAQERTKVTILGTFHFAYPELDRIKTTSKDKIDFNDPKRLSEVNDLVDKLAKFKPTIIALEIKTWDQAKTDSLYNLYLEGKYSLPVNESYMVGFQLAKKLGLKNVHCIDAWGNIDAYFTGDGKNQFDPRPDKVNFMQKLEAFSDSLLKAKPVQETSGGKEKPYLTITEILRQLNQPEKIKNDHAQYFKNLFLFEEKEGDYAGVDWISSSWFNRNLRIFRNIQKLTENPDDKILVIYGSGHLGLLSQYISDSPGHILVPVLDYLD